MKGWIRYIPKEQYPIEPMSRVTRPEYREISSETWKRKKVVAIMKPSSISSSTIKGRVNGRIEYTLRKMAIVAGTRGFTRAAVAFNAG